MWNLVFVKAILLSTSYAWNYEDGDEGPANWAKLDNGCGGLQQSPVNIPPYTNTRKFKFNKLIQSAAYQSSMYVNISKDDHTVTIIPLSDDNHPPKISGGPLKGQYILDNIHFHWGDRDLYGSEHTLNGYSTSLEMHAVHYNAKYPNTSVASAYKDGLAVVAYLYRVGGNKYSELSTITKSFSQLQQRSDTEITLDEQIKLSQLAIPFNNYYAAYSGSLTTPPCSETVTWIIFEYVLPVSRDVMRSFRSLYGSTPSLRNNFRPLQNLNGRSIIHKSIWY